jgi:hypothetical protein
VRGTSHATPRRTNRAAAWLFLVPCLLARPYPNPQLGNALKQSQHWVQMEFSRNVSRGGVVWGSVSAKRAGVPLRGGRTGCLVVSLNSPRAPPPPATLLPVLASGCERPQVQPSFTAEPYKGVHVSTSRLLLPRVSGGGTTPGRVPGDSPCEGSAPLPSPFRMIASCPMVVAALRARQDGCVCAGVCMRAPVLEQANGAAEDNLPFLLQELDVHFAEGPFGFRLAVSAATRPCSPIPPSNHHHRHTPPCSALLFCAKKCVTVCDTVCLYLAAFGLPATTLGVTLCWETPASAGSPACRRVRCGTPANVPSRCVGAPSSARGEGRVR